MRSQRMITRLLLLFVLMAGQHFALVHAVTHIPHRAAAGTKESGLPHAKLCIQCLLSVHVTQALSSSAPVPPSIAVVLPEAAPVRGSHIAAPFLGFRSRAPPAPL